jgi:hypothetical protein
MTMQAWLFLVEMHYFVPQSKDPLTLKSNLAWQKVWSSEWGITVNQNWNQQLMIFITYKSKDLY